MGHLLKEYRGKVDLIYIDPPFDSKADYKKKIELKGKKVENDNNAFEAKQYGDIWTNDEYLQFMYERLKVMWELLSDTGSIYLHCDWHKSHHLRCLMDEIFGPDKLVNEIIWCYTGPGTPNMKQFNRKHDNIFWYSKTSKWIFNEQDIRIPYKDPNQKPRKAFLSSEGNDFDEDAIQRMRERGCVPTDWWEMAIAARHKIDEINRTGYPTEKPLELLERIIKASSNPGDLVFDCFMGSGTTQAVAMKLGRRFIGADINLGAVQTTTKRLINVYNEIEDDKKVGFEVYNVNNYDFFRNPIEARDLLIDALEIQKFSGTNVFDGELDGRNVKILPVNRITTKADLSELVANLPYKAYEKSMDENPNDPVDAITLVCMGHEPDLKASLQQQVGKYKLDIEIVDILRDKKDLELKREAVALAKYFDKDGKTYVQIVDFYPMNLCQKLSIQGSDIEDYRQLVDSIMIDYNYDGEVLKPQILDVPDKKNLVKGTYEIPKEHGTIRIKITDLLSESIEIEAREYDGKKHSVRGK